MLPNGRDWYIEAQLNKESEMLNSLLIAGIGAGLFASAGFPSGIEMDMADPSDKNHDNTIKVCVNDNAQDCDYQSYPAGGIFSSNLSFPIRAYFTLPHNIVKIYGPGEVNSTGEFSQITVTSPDFGPMTMQDGTFNDYLYFETREDEKKSYVMLNVPATQVSFGSLLAFPTNTPLDWEMTIVVSGYPFFTQRRPQPIDFVLKFTSVVPDCFDCYTPPYLPKLNLLY